MESPATKPWDIVIDCLDMIFDYLDFEDLLNFADACTLMRYNCGVVYGRKYAPKDILLHIKAINRKAAVGQNQIEIVNIKTGLQLLRCFGQHVRSIDIFASYLDINSNFFSKELIAYTNQYCSKRLNTFKLSFIQSPAFEFLIEPFLNLETIEFNLCGLDSRITQFNKFFPRINSLKLYCNQYQSHECFDKQLPNLTNLTIDASSTNELNFCTIKNVSTFLHANQQIDHLKLFTAAKVSFLHEVSNTLEKLEMLDTRCDCKELCIYNGNSVQFNALKIFKITVLHTTSDLRLTNLPFLMKNLEQLDIDVKHMADNALLDFLEKHKKIKIIKLYSYRDMIDVETKFKILDILTELREFDLSYYWLSTSDVIAFTTRTNSWLNKFTFTFNQPLNELEENINTNEWDIIRGNLNYVTVQKR